MNYRLACKDCGGQPCVCQEFECPDCKGTGEVGDRPTEQDCITCKGTGWLKCRGPNPSCPWSSLDTCYCEAAWERQQEDLASEPPMTMREQHMLAYEEKRKLRS